ncbi:IS66 family transposase [Leptospira jelokensis]|uniref:IS66 family transposase n=1 Tax=Leptospira jelokensis TaxID=2484931 RepID=A0A4Z1A3H8_9LEPT|nr:IS66 family transposase [Leptospira jelokensis]
MDQSNLTENPDHIKNIHFKSNEEINKQEDVGDTPNEKDIHFKFDLNAFKSELFGTSSEYWSPTEVDDGLLFNEIELIYDDEKKLSNDNKKGTPCSYTNGISQVTSNPGHCSILDQLPVKNIIHDIPTSRKKCKCGQKLESIGSEQSDKVDFIPPQINVIRHIYLKYRCSKCNDSEIKIASSTPQFLSNEVADVGMLAYLFVSKFLKGIPFSRFGNIFSKYGFGISKTNLSNYAISSYKRLKYLENDFWKELYTSNYLQITETPVQFIQKERLTNTTQPYLYVLRGINRGKPIIRFYYIQNQNKEAISEKLKYYKGIIQTKGIYTFDALTEENSKIANSCCWGYFRKMFSEILTTDEKHEGATKIIQFIDEIYEIEDKTKHLSREERKLYRQTVSRRVIDKIFDTIDRKTFNNPSNQLYTQAIQLLNSHTNQLLVFMDHPELPLDTSLAENDLRPFANENEHWLFTENSEGAETSTFFYSLLETAKANGYDPDSYLKNLCLKVQSGETPKLFQVD